MDNRTKLLLDSEMMTPEQHQTFKEMLLRLLDDPQIQQKIGAFLRAELDRIGPAQEDLCHDFFQRAVALELSFFEASYADRT